jgi:hypothetical protein
VGSAIILPGLPEQFEEIRFLARNPEQSGAGEDMPAQLIEPGRPRTVLLPLEKPQAYRPY